MADGPAPQYVTAGGNTEGAKAVILIGEDGNFYSATGGGGGGGGDASAANQVITNAKLDTLHADIATTLVGFVDDLEASVDNLALETSVDGLEALITATNTKLDTIHGDFTGLALNTSVDGIEGLLTTQSGFLDGLETLIGSSNTKLDTLHTDLTGLALNTSVDGIEGLIGTTNTTLTTIDGRVDTLEAIIGATNETAAATDTTTSGLNGLIKRLNQHETTTDAFLDGLEGLIGTTNTNTTGLALNTSVDGLEGFTDGLEALITSTNGFVDGLEALIGTTNINTTGLALNTSVDGLEGSVDGLESQTGIVTETAPASDTASSGLNGRLQRVAQRITTLLAVFPTTLDMNSGVKSASTQRVTLATDQVQLTNALKVDGSAVTQPVSGTVSANATLSAETTKVIGTINVAAAQSIAATQSGTWTVQPGNTANTTAWKVDGSAVTQPVSIASATGGDQSADGLATSLVGLNGRSFPYKFNGTTWDREFSCQNTAVITVAAATTVQIVALAAAKRIYVCSFVISTSNTTSSTGNIFKTGTGSLCATGITSLTGSMHMGPIGHIELSAPTGSILFKGAAASALCLTNGTNGVDGFLTYAQF